MSTALITLFGSEITARAQRREADREFNGFAGAHGLTSMLLGSRGKDVIVKGVIRGTGNTYDLARADAIDSFDSMETWLFAPADDYTFHGDTYESVVWNKITMVPDAAGKMFRQTSSGNVIVEFVAYGRSLV